MSMLSRSWRRFGLVITCISIYSGHWAARSANGKWVLLSPHRAAFNGEQSYSGRTEDELRQLPMTGLEIQISRTRVPSSCRYLRHQPLRN